MTNGIQGGAARSQPLTFLFFFFPRCDLVCTASYQASFPGFSAAMGLDPPQVAELLQVSVGLVRAALPEAAQTTSASDRWWRRDCGPVVVASIGSYGASLANGAEYTGEYELARDQYADFYREKIKALAEALLGGSRSGVLAFETIPRADEAAAICWLMLVEFPSVPFWVSFQCRDEHTLGCGDRIANAVTSIMVACDNAALTAGSELRKALPPGANSSVQRSTGCLIGVGVNCFRPSLAPALVRTLRDLLPAHLEVCMCMRLFFIF
jgi:S-methylmethionine-dependent homocysteine/selenocysteine methylase